MPMELDRLEAMLQELTQLHSPRREVNIFSIGSPGYYENPTSDLLAFFLKSHGMLFRLRQPIEFEALDGKPIDIVFLLLLPESAKASS